MKSYPVTCKIGGVPVAGFPRFFKQTEVDLAMGQDDYFPRTAAADIIDLGGKRYAYKNAGEARLILGDRPR